MSTLSRFRNAIAQPLSHLTQIETSSISKLLSTPKATSAHQFSLPIPRLLAQADHTPNNVAAYCQELADKFEPNAFIEKATASGPLLQFNVQPLEYIKSTLKQVYAEKDLYGHHIQPAHDRKTVVLDYSSPNIAKPFHAGHLRSTILGNFIKRIHDANGYKAIGINYLGDWGKQYGLLAVGFELFGDSEALLKDPIHHLYQVYVKINELAKTNFDIDQRANAYFKKMEDGDEEALGQWRRFRDLSIESYKEIYQRLGIEFDHYSGESQTEPFIPKVYDLLKERDLIKKTEDGAWIIDLEPYRLGKPVVRRADGTSLYMTRDLASIMLRRRLFGSFDKAVYVVGTEQELYLKQLFKICELLEFPIDMHHANFGRVLGMSTRKGTVVFLQDILDTAKECMLENVRQSNPSMSSHQHELVADKLGASAVLVQDMIAKRIKNYEFSWDRMTAAKGYTGVYLQYTFARMCSIEDKVNIPITDQANLSLLKEKEAFELSLTVSQLPDITRSACQSMDPSVIVQYLFRLAHATSQANSALRVKGADTATAEARMLLFWAARTTLANGLHMLGIEPLRRV
ncbi:arginyl-tRNA synthetase [Blakeslea trispora]|nr:arginyl-tRNA synthetase [Blakeslea trispora]